MRIRGEIKIPCEYMSDNATQDWLQKRVANEITQEILRSNFIKFTEEYRQGYYIMRGEVEIDPDFILEGNIIDLLNNYYDDGLRDGFRRAKRVYNIKDDEEV